MAFDPAMPFALMADEAMPGFRLFTDLRGVVETGRTDDMAALLEAMRGCDDWLAGGMSYEAGHGLEQRLRGRERAPGLAWFGRFSTMQAMPADAAMELLEGIGGAVALGPVQPQLSATAFLDSVSRVQALIASGDLYQANVTFAAHVAVAGHPAALFRRLWLATRPPLAALVHRGQGRWWISLSPELFFRMTGAQVTARPMKGTARRSADPDADAAVAAGLAADPKNRAENLMITDLIRNDLARVALPGTVRVAAPFRVERHGMVHQMTSTVTAALEPGRTAPDVLVALFPCGSITGAPKLRAMEVIAEVEAAPRGIYCGAIGWVAPGGSAAAFNVAIRTLAIDPAVPGVARLGLGSGIVADSVGSAEWAECLLKARFLEARPRQALIETMRREAGVVAMVGRHLDRMAASAGWLGTLFDRARAERMLAALPAAGCVQRVRLLLAPSGALAVEAGPAPAASDRPLRVAVVPLPVPEDDWRLSHKTADRAFYDDARTASGADEVLFRRADGSLTEGSFTSLFVAREGRLLTPAGPGLLPGVLRAELLASGQAAVTRLTTADLADGFLLGNALRGLIPARLADGEGTD